MMKEPYFDIEWITELVIQQEPDRLDIIDQLKTTERKKWIRQSYVNLFPEELLNNSGSEWRIDESLALEHPTEGTIVIDVLKNGKIKGIEFLNQIF